MCTYLLTSMWDSVCVLKLMQAGDSDIALIEACRLGHVERATVLLDHEANVNYKDWVRKNISIVHVTVP